MVALVTSHRTIEFGLLVCMVGAVMIAIGASSFLRHPTPETGLRQRWWTLAGALALALGFGIQIAGALAK